MESKKAANCIEAFKGADTADMWMAQTFTSIHACNVTPRLPKTAYTCLACMKGLTNNRDARRP